MFPFIIYTLLAIVFGIALSIYLWAQRSTKYWKRHNIPYIPALPFLGNFKDILFIKSNVSEKFNEFYFDKNVKNAPAIGINMFHRPALFIRDPELVKRILVKDFNSFNDRYSNSDIHTDVLGGANLFFLRNPSWKIIRNRLSPFFTSGKLKQMFYLMDSVGNDLNRKLLSLETDGKTKGFITEIKEYVSRFTTDVIASCAYGVQANSLEDPESEFRRNGRKVFHFDLRRSLEWTAMFFLPQLVPIFRVKLFTGEATEFLRKTLRFVMEERVKSGATRNDLIDTLIVLENDDKDKKLQNTDIVFQGDVVVAQASVFFTAGFETSSSAMSFGLYELAMHSDMQKRLREEIRKTLLDNNNEISYDMVNAMEYLNMVFMEVLRMYPILPFLDRRCTAKEGYSLEPFYDFNIPEDMPVIIPIYAMQMDPNYYPNPHAFDPERFSKENIETHTPYTYMPFGTGPHNCIGERFGILQAKVGLINVLRNHYVSPTAKTPKTMILDKKAMLIQPEGGVHLLVTRDPLI